MSDLTHKIALEDIATVFAGEFVRMCKPCLNDNGYTDSETGRFKSNIPFLKMSYIRRRKLIEKVLGKLVYNQ